MKVLLRYNFLITACLTFSFLLACKDDTAEDIKSPEELKAEKVNKLAGTEGKAWIIQTAISGGFDIAQFLPACEKDNLYVLYPNGEGEYKNGEEKCDESDPEIIETGYWDLSEDLDSLTLTIGMFSNNSKILELTENRLQLEMSYQNQNVVATFQPVE